MPSAPDHFSSARDMLEALSRGQISAAELLELHVERFEAANPKINAVVQTDLNAARERAAELDRLAAQGAARGPLHGLPMTVKDTFDVFGMPATAGAPEYAARPLRTPDALAVARLREAGAVIWGKTNTPYLAGDNQTYNPVHGRTCNPHDLARTPGGSSGGAAAALATGMTPLELGSDIGGSLRLPAHFCGVAAHKPTFGHVPIRGHVPPEPGSISVRDLNVAGPMARNAADLRLLYGVLSGVQTSAGSRRASLRGKRIGLWSEEESYPLDKRCAAALAEAGDAAHELGAHVAIARPGIAGPALMDLYLQLLLPILATDMPAPLVKAMQLGRPITRLLAKREPYSRSKWALYSAASHHDWLKANEARERLKLQMAEFFEDWHVLLAPIAPTPAFAHVERGDSVTRLLEVDGEPTPYHTFHGWIALATVCHLPAAVIPAPRRPGELPAGIQIIGPEGSDLEVLAVAEALEAELGGFVPPPEVQDLPDPPEEDAPKARNGRKSARKANDRKPPKPAESRKTKDKAR